MFSILGMINSYIGYFSMNAKLKSQVYTALGTLGNFYLLYVAYRFFANGFYLRGFLYILAFFVLAYFAYLNILYYFTKDKSSKYDITPKIEQLLGIKAKDHLAEYEKRKSQAPGYVQTNGIFKDEEFLPSVVTTNAEQKANIQTLVKDLANIGYLDLNYGGMTEDDMLAIVREGSATSFQALVEPVALPYFELVERTGRMFIYGGTNQMEAKQLGEVKTIGLLSAREAARRYKLSVATACLTKGPVSYTHLRAHETTASISYAVFCSGFVTGRWMIVSRTAAGDWPLFSAMSPNRLSVDWMAVLSVPTKRV